MRNAQDFLGYLMGILVVHLLVSFLKIKVLYKKALEFLTFLDLKNMNYLFNNDRRFQDFLAPIVSI